MFNYKSKWDATKRAWSEGQAVHKELGLEKDYRNWSPAMLFSYQLGIVTTILFLIAFYIGWSISGYYRFGDKVIEFILKIIK